MVAQLAVPAFIAGLFTFLAPCTLPLVPGYLGFISGVSLDDLKNPSTARRARRKIFLNGVLYTVGFSLVFIMLGSLVGLGASALAQYRGFFGRLGGIFIILFGLFMVAATRLPFLNFLARERRIPILAYLRPGKPISSLLFGATFALGWTPCVGPILGSVLILAATSTTALQGTILLAIFSLGLAIPFLIIAAGVGWVAAHISKLSVALEWVSVVGGGFLVFLGILLATDNLGLFVAWFFQAFSFLQLEERLLNYL